MEPKDIIAEALQAVTDAEVPEDLKVIAFSKAVDIILHERVPSNGAPSPSARAHMGGGASTRGPIDGEDMVDKIAREVGLDATVVGRVFREVDGEPHLNLATNQLPTSKTPATRDIALLMVLARNAAGLDDYTSVTEIRKEADHFNKLDSSNFAATISGMNSNFRVRGSGQNKELKLNQPGREAAIGLVKRLGGGEN